MRVPAVFPKKQALPGSQQQSAVRERDCFRRAGERHFDVTWHVIRTFRGVLEVAIVLRNQAIEPALEIASRRGVRIFHQDQ